LRSVLIVTLRIPSTMTASPPTVPAPNAAAPNAVAPPAPRPADSSAPATRRRFFARLLPVTVGWPLAVGLVSLAATHVLWLLGSIRFLFPNVLIEPPSKFRVGRPDDYAPGQVETRYTTQYGVWIVRHEYAGQPQIYALRSVCTHLGCAPLWLESEQKFKCPCHGSGFYKDGLNFEGPAPRPLERYAIRLTEDGELEVDKNRLFQEQLGQWRDPASFVAG
jgi:cytochrome b6-f complex iron-sulfur subunit